MKKIIPLILLNFLVGCSSVSVNNNSKNEESPIVSKGENYECNYTFDGNKNGAFYKTDGPLELPANINEIPEPTPKLEKLNKWVNKEYSVLGQTFYPYDKLVDYKEVGEATWYGKRYHGKKTSSGEIYDMFKITAASPVLPISSYARVTNLENGRSIIVKVNDRGPFLRGRVIDLSFLAACRLDYVKNGKTKVLVESIVPNQ